LGGEPLVSYTSKNKRGKTLELIHFAFHTKNDLLEISFEKDKGEWLLNTLDRITVQENNSLTFAQLKEDFESHFENFELFWYSKPIKKLRNFGLLVL